jgi:hypothetical protein
MANLHKLFTIIRYLQTSSKFLIGAVIIASSTFIFTAFAMPPSSPYSLGETLAPTCAPGDTYCTVDVPQGSNGYLTDIASITSNQGDIIYFNGTDWVDLAPGTSGYFLKTLGADANPAWANADIDINGMTEESIINDADTLAIYDDSSSSVKKITRANFLSGILGALTYQGMWDATGNSPTLTDGTGTLGQYYVVEVSGSRNLGSGSITFTVGDWVVHNGTAWEKLDSTNDVQSVFGRTNIITAATSDYDAVQIDNTAAGTIAATNVQTALNELDTEKQVAHAYLADIAAVTGTQGDILYFDGTDWVDLAPGTDGYFLQTNGAGANPSWEDTSVNIPGTVIASVSWNANTTTSGEATLGYKKNHLRAFRLTTGIWSIENMGTNSLIPGDSADWVSNSVLSGTGDPFFLGTFGIVALGQPAVTLPVSVSVSATSLSSSPNTGNLGNIIIKIRDKDGVVADPTLSDAQTFFSLTYIE